MSFFRINITLYPYIRISINKLNLKVNNATSRKIVMLSVYPFSIDIS